jgi:hypothetical protein
MVIRFVVDDQLLIAATFRAPVVIALQRLFAAMLPLSRAQPGPVMLARVGVVATTLADRGLWP